MSWSLGLSWQDRRRLRIERGRDGRSLRGRDGRSLSTVHCAEVQLLQEAFPGPEEAVGYV